MKLPTALLAVSLLGSAATPVASLRSSSDFQLSGVTVNTAGVSSWPVLPGDKIAAGASAAMIRFVDGSVVTLAPGSQARVEKDNDNLGVRLLSGSMSFVAASESVLRFYSGNTQIQARSGVASSPSTGTASSGASLSRGIIVGTPPPLSRY